MVSSNYFEMDQDLNDHQQFEDANALVLFQRAVGSAKNGIVLTDPRLPDNPIIYANPFFLHLTGYRTDEIVGKNCRFLQSSDQNQSSVNDIRLAVKEQRPLTTVLRNYRKDGSLFWNELTISPVFDHSGVLTNFVGIQNDITARMEAEKRVSEFYSVISHELRTPLSAIRGALTVVEEGDAGKINSQALRLVRIARSASDRLMRLINDILDLKKIESGMVKVNYRVVDPKELVHTTRNDLQAMIEESKVKLSLEIKARRPVKADPDKIVQVLANMLANAVKFSPPGSSIIIKVDDIKDGATRFAIVDEGPGIPQDQLSKLFVRFQQLDSSDSRKKGGSGLGLAICKSIVELHGGEIGVDSTPGKGSEFWFTLPR